MEASINSILSQGIHTVLTHLLINFEQFEATERLCSNLPKFAATPEITQICHFEAKWLLAIDKTNWNSIPITSEALRLYFRSAEPSAATGRLRSNFRKIAAKPKCH